MKNHWWQPNPWYVVSISKRVILLTIPMTQMVVRGGNCKKRSLNTDMCKRGCIQQNFQTNKTFFRFLRRKREDFSSKTLTAKWIGSKNFTVNKWYMQLFKWITFKIDWKSEVLRITFYEIVSLTRYGYNGRCKWKFSK